MQPIVRRPDDPAPRPAPVRARPPRRSLVVRLLVTALAAALTVGAWWSIDAYQGPETAIGVVLGAPILVLAFGLVVWAWRRHPY